MVPSDVPGTRRGAGMGTVTGGDGLFADAHGIITSNFAVTADGELVDNHFGRIYVREQLARLREYPNLTLEAPA